VVATRTAHWRDACSRDGRVRDRRGTWRAYYTLILLLCAASFISYIDRTTISVGAIPMKAQFGWSATQEGLVLSAFFVGYLVMMPASGALANRYGGKLVLGLAVLWWSLFTVLTPPAASLSLSALMIARIALGLGEASVFPASINLIGRWVPAETRTRAVTALVSCIHLGTVVSLPITGWLIHRFSWPIPFYVFGIVGFVWVAVWFTRAGARGRTPPADSLRALGAIPWGRLMRLPCVWAIVIGHFCANWTVYVLLAWLPTYFKATFGGTIMHAGLISAAPWLVAFVCANSAGVAADRLLGLGRGPTFVRKLMQCAGLVGAAVGLLMLCNVTSHVVALVLMCVTTGSVAVCLAGYAPNGLDIAPAYADVIFGISNTFATLPGIFGIAVTGWLVDRTHSFTAPFILSAGVALFGALFFLIFASGERQDL
jgi:MFS transporter, ACS family, solute carrier family 17 (sodium-dependent inorganic phosphate cotransporter), other